MAWNDYYLKLEEALACLLSGTDEDGAALPVAAGGHTKVVRVTMTLDTGAYADGDVLAEVQEVASALRIAAGSGWIRSVGVLDKSDQGEALDVVFFNASGSLGTENAAVSITDADAAKIVGVVVVGGSDFADLANSQYAHKEPLIPLNVAAGSSIYVGLVSRGTGTYAADGIDLVLGILQE